MALLERGTPISWARCYFGAQALAGALWWALVLVSEDVARWTLGTWEPLWVIGPDLVLFVGASALAALSASRGAAWVAAGWSVAVTVALGYQGLVGRTAGAGFALMLVASAASVVAAAVMWFGHLPTAWVFVGPFSFRPAREARSSRHLGRSIAQLVVFWSVFFVVVPVTVGWIETRLRLDWSALDGSAVDVLAVVILVPSSAFAIWSCVTMALRGRGTPLPAETARELVVAGPYRWVRNPMALAGALQTAAVGLWVGSWAVVVIAAAGAFVWDVVIRPVEEADLLERFGDRYERYREQVRCWLPRVPRPPASSSVATDVAAGGSGASKGT